MISHFQLPIFLFVLYYSSETIITISEALQIYNIYSKGATLPLLKIVKPYKITGNRRENRADYRL